MAEPTKAEKLLANLIVWEGVGEGTDDYASPYEKSPEYWEDRIARALAAAREQAVPPKGHVLCDDGTVREAHYTGKAQVGSGLDNVRTGEWREMLVWFPDAAEAARPTT